MTMARGRGSCCCVARCTSMPMQRYRNRNEVSGVVAYELGEDFIDVKFVDGDIYRWGSLMAGALMGSLPLVILYAFFVEHYVSAMTGAVKE